jgi:selenium metabolism protein YedF
MKSFLYALTQVENIKQMIFMNSGVFLTTEGSDVLESLKTMEESGVEILSCGTCLDYYGLKDKLAVGEVTNMYTAVELLTSAAKAVTL